MGRNRILKNTVAYSLADFSGPLISVFMLPIYTRYMTPNDYGIVSIVQSFTHFVAVFGSLQISAGLGRLFFDYDDRQKRTYFSSVLVAVTGTAVLILLPIHLFGDSLTGLMFPNAGIPYAPYFFLGISTVFFNQIVIATNRLQKSREKGLTVGLISVATILLGVGIRLWLVVGLEMGAHGALLATLANAGVHAFLLIISASSFLTFKVDVAMMFASLRYGFPLVFHAFGGYLFMYSDRVILEKFVSVAAIGLYNVADRLSMAMKILVNSVNAALSPRFVKASQQSKEEAVAWYTRVMVIWAVLVTNIGLVIILFIKEIVSIIVGPAYESAYLFVIPLTIGYFFRGLYMFGINALLVEKKSAIVPVVTLVSGIANVMTTIYLVGLIGTMGAALSTLVAFIISWILSLLLSRRYYPLVWPWRSFFTCAIPLSLSAIAQYILNFPTGPLATTVKIAFWISSVWVLLFINGVSLGEVFLENHTQADDA